MKRYLQVLVLAAGLVAVVGACDGGDGGTQSWGAGAGGGSGPSCGQFNSCESCTPQEGCGWCFNAAGGQCVSDPDQCAYSSNSEFTWTWNLSGCPNLDASVAPPSRDAGSGEASSSPEAAAPEGGVAEAAAEAGAPSPEDAASPSVDAPWESGAADAAAGD